MEILVGYLLLGAVAGVLAGLLGVGGGLVIVPVLVALWKMDGLTAAHIMQLAVGTSLATIVFTSISSVRAHHRKGAVLWPAFWRLAPGVVIGAWLSAAVAVHLPGAALKDVFGVFELLVALQMGFGVRASAHRDLPGRWGMGLAGAVIGAVSSIIGIGGGTMTVPFLSWCSVSMQRAIGTSAACGLPIAVGGTLGYIAMGWGADGLPAWSAGYVYLPALLGISAASIVFAPLGAALAHRMSTQLLRRIFAGFLALLGVWMLSTHLST